MFSWVNKIEREEFERREEEEGVREERRKVNEDWYEGDNEEEEGRCTENTKHREVDIHVTRTKYGHPIYQLDPNKIFEKQMVEVLYKLLEVEWQDQWG